MDLELPVDLHWDEVRQLRDSDRRAGMLAVYRTEQLEEEIRSPVDDAS